MRQTIAIAGLSIGSLAAMPAQARFLESDAEQIDPEDRLNTETYNDILSYRYPLSWERRWQQTNLGLRVHAGSLNVNRFHYLEEIKLTAHWKDVPVFSFRRDRREDFLEQRTEQEVRLSGKPLPWLMTSIMADGGTYKQFGDVGMAAGIHLDRERMVEAYYWSVDHYYETKKDFPGDKRDKETKTWGLVGTWKWEDVRAQGRIEQDLPLSWRRESRDYWYDYWRKTGSLRLAFGDPDHETWFIVGEHEQKEEFKRFLEEGETTHAKGMWREVSTVDFGRELRTPEADYTAGVLLVRRDMRGRFSAVGDPTKSVREELGPSYSRRREAALYGSYHQTGGEWAPLYGLQANHVRIDEDERLFKGEEVKFQAALEWNARPDFSMLLNTTWDLDQLQRDFPYDQESFRPWGGGDIQFVAVF